MQLAISHDCVSWMPEGVQQLACMAGFCMQGYETSMQGMPLHTALRSFSQFNPGH